MLLGYARVSTTDQETSAQEDALAAEGVERTYVEEASGGRWDRPELQRMLSELRSGDVVVVWKLDRLTRSLSDLLRILETIEAAGAGFRSITEAIDTTTPAGRMVASMLGAFAQFERDMIRERTKAGLERAKQQGRHGGRPRKITEEQAVQIKRNVEAGEWTGSQAARMFNVHPSTISRLLARLRAAPVASRTPAKPKRRVPAPSPPPSHPQVEGGSLESFVALVMDTARTLPKEGWWGEEKAFIHALWHAARVHPATGSLDQFKRNLVEANRAGLLALCRADLVQAMDANVVMMSETSYLNATFHFVEVPSHGADAPSASIALDAQLESAIAELGQGRRGVRVRLAELRKRMPKIPRESLDATLLAMEIQGRLVLSPLDDPREIAEADQVATVRTPSGSERHLVYLT